jgi:hypothetical protein
MTKAATLESVSKPQKAEPSYIKWKTPMRMCKSRFTLLTPTT